MFWSLRKWSGGIEGKGRKLDCGHVQPVGEAAPCSLLLFCCVEPGITLPGGRGVWEWQVSTFPHGASDGSSDLGIVLEPSFLLGSQFYASLFPFLPFLCPSVSPVSPLTLWLFVKCSVYFSGWWSQRGENSKVYWLSVFSIVILKRSFRWSLAIFDFSLSFIS